MFRETDLLWTNLVQLHITGLSQTRNFCNLCDGQRVALQSNISGALWANSEPLEKDAWCFSTQNGWESVISSRNFEAGICPQPLHYRPLTSPFSTRQELQFWQNTHDTQWRRGLHQHHAVKFWVTMMCNLDGGYQSFKEKYCLHLHCIMILCLGNHLYQSLNKRRGRVVNTPPSHVGGLGL